MTNHLGGAKLIQKSSVNKRDFISHTLNCFQDQRGSPAYISPDVLSGKPYLGKPSDMWALGVVLFTMLYGQFPFYDSVPQELFSSKIKILDYLNPTNVQQNMLQLCSLLKTDLIAESK